MSKRKRQIHLVAHLYYNRDWDQPAISRFMQVSQSKVSRLLGEARAQNIIRISVAPYDSRNRGLEQSLMNALPLKNGVVVSDAVADMEEMDNESQATALRGNLSHFAAEAVAGMISERSTVVVGVGRVLRDLIRELPAPTAPQSITAVQGVGHVDPNIADYDSSELCRNLSLKWGGSFYSLSAPAILPDSEMRHHLLKMEAIRRVREKYSSADTALIGIGLPKADMSIYRELIFRKTLTEAELDVVKRAGAVAEICGRYITAEGEECDSPLRERTLNVDIETLRKIPNVIAVVEGNLRSEAILATILGGIVKSVVLDEGGARALLDHAAIAARAPGDNKRASGRNRGR